MRASLRLDTGGNAAVCYIRITVGAALELRMNLNLESLTPARVAARLAQSNFGVAEPLLGVDGPPIPSALEVRDLIEDLREVLFPGLTDGRPRSNLWGQTEIEERLAGQ